VGLEALTRLFAKNFLQWIIFKGMFKVSKIRASVGQSQRSWF